MDETTNVDDAGDGQDQTETRLTNDPGAAKPPLQINAQYIKDLSFEAPSAPGIFRDLQNAKPDISVNVNVQAKPLGNEAYEVVLGTRAECKAGANTAFLVELAYAGVFTLNVPAEAVRPVLLIECPRLLYPFARQILASTTREGGFLPLMLGPVDFAGMYQKAAQEAQAQAPAGPSVPA